MGASTSVQLAQQFPLPESMNEACRRLRWFMERYATRFLEEQLWDDAVLTWYRREAKNKQNTYRVFDELDLFKDDEVYMYQRFERCIQQRLAQILDAHVDEHQAFQFVVDTVEEREIKSVGYRKLKQAYYETSADINWASMETVTEKLNRYYRKHGRFPDEYTELVSCPQPNGTISFAPDSRGDVMDTTYHHDEGEFQVTLKAPADKSPSSYQDWDEYNATIQTHDYFETIAENGTLKNTRLHRQTTKQGTDRYVLDVPVELNPDSGEVPDTDSERVLGVDLGVKKQVTAVVMERTNNNCENNDCTHNGDNHLHQVSKPLFVDHRKKQKLFRLNNEAQSLSAKLQRLEDEGLAGTAQYSRLKSEMKRTRRKERNLREQIQHNIANQLAWIAVKFGCGAVVFEDLASLSAPKGKGSSSWAISSWARGDLIEKVTYRGDCLGIKTVKRSPYKSSRHCPRCGEEGVTVKAPDNRVETRSGGHFICTGCDYEADRDFIGAANMARKYLTGTPTNGTKIEEANPAAYMDAGEYASPQSRPVRDVCRSVGVRPARAGEPVGKPPVLVRPIQDEELLWLVPRSQRGTQIDGHDDSRPTDDHGTRQVTLAGYTECD